MRLLQLKLLATHKLSATRLQFIKFSERIFLVHREHNLVRAFLHTYEQNDEASSFSYVTRQILLLSCSRSWIERTEMIWLSKDNLLDAFKEMKFDTKLSDVLPATLLKERYCLTHTLAHLLKIDCRINQCSTFIEKNEKITIMSGVSEVNYSAYKIWLT